MNDNGIIRVFDNFRALSDKTIQIDKEKKDAFIEACKKSFNKKENWTFWLPLITSLNLCVKCATCAEACPVYLSSNKNPLYHPVRRSDILRKVYNRLTKYSGKLMSLFNNIITDEEVNALAESVYRCTVCRKCAYVCPIGVDNGLISREIRKIFTQIGVIPDELYDNGTILQRNFGNATKLPNKAFLNILSSIKEEIKDYKGIDVDIPIDKEGADYLILNNSGDYMAFMETIIGQVEILNATKLDWTYNSIIDIDYDPNKLTNDVVAYGLFFSDNELMEVAKSHLALVKRLKPKTLVIGECGHAYEVHKYIYRDILPEWKNINVISILELFNDLINSGRLKVDLEKNPERTTYHDSCKLGRLGGLYNEPRNILKNVCKDFVELNPCKEMSICCGGGGGLALMSKDDFLKFKMGTYGKMKSEQLIKSEAKTVALACSNCKAQFRDIINYYHLDIEFKGISEIIANALVY